MTALSRLVSCASATALLLMACGSGEPAPASREGPRATPYPRKAIEIMAPVNDAAVEPAARALQAALTDEKLVDVDVRVSTMTSGGPGEVSRLMNAKAGESHALIVVGRTMAGAQLAGKADARVSQLTPIARLLGEPEVIVVRAGSPYASVTELMEALRLDARSVRIGGGPKGGIDHELAARIVKDRSGSALNLSYVPFASAAETAIALGAGRVDVGVGSYRELKALIATGKATPLAISADQPLASARHIPTLRSLGVNIALVEWRLLAAPPGVSPNDVVGLKELVQKIQASSAWSSFVARDGWAESFTTEGLEDYLLEEEEFLIASLRALGLIESPAPTPPEPEPSNP